jgi:hypothetical protein
MLGYHLRVALVPRRRWRHAFARPGPAAVCWRYKGEERIKAIRALGRTAPNLFQETKMNAIYGKPSLAPQPKARPRAWIMFSSGRRIDLLRPDPRAWHDQDLAIGLSRTYRWGGHSSWELPLSVAQHSLAVLAIREQRSPVPLTGREKLRELLHDGTECLIGGWDPLTPIKQFMGPDLIDIFRRLQAALNQRYDLPPWTVESHRRHKEADHLAAASEALHVVGWRKPGIRRTLGITLPPLERDPLMPLPNMSPWEPWPAYMAAELFLIKLHSLQAETVAEIATSFEFVEAAE